MIRQEIVLEFYPGCTDEQLASYEIRTQIKLPKPLREFYKETNSLRMSPDAVLPIVDGSVAGAFLIHSIDENSRKIANDTNVLLGEGSELLVFARDGTGNALTVDLTGEVYFWDHDTDEFHFVADNPIAAINEFIIRKD